MLTREDVEKVAVLARLELAEGEIEQFTAQLAKIVTLVEQLNLVDTSGIEEMAHPLDLHSVLRGDQLQPGLTREQALANSPNQDGEFFLVPPVLARKS